MNISIASAVGYVSTLMGDSLNAQLMSLMACTPKPLGLFWPFTVECTVIQEAVIYLH